MLSLKFKGGAILPGIPNRDLTEDEIKNSDYTKAELLKSGLWIEAQPEKTPVKKAGK